MSAGTDPHSQVRDSPRRDRRLLAGAFLLLVAVIVAYIPAMNGGFIWDDDSYVTENPLLRDWHGLKHIWIPGPTRETSTPQYYPAVFTSLWIEFQLWGLNARGYHQVNVLLHALNAMLVWRLCRRIGIPGGWLVAAIFALHPVHVESVAWITERKNVLSGLFYLASMLAYLKFDATASAATGQDRPRRWRWYALAFVLYVLALLSKSVTCSLPAALILIMLFRRQPLTPTRLLPLVPMFVIGLVLALNTAAVERDHVGASGEEFAFSLADRFIIAANALLFYPQKIIWPWPLMFIYPRWEINTQSVAAWMPAASLAVIGLGCIVAYLRGWRGPPLAIAFFTGTIFPALGFVNIYPMVFSFVADHFQYLASLGIVALIVGAVHAVGGSRAVLVAGILALPVLAALTWLQATTYASAESVFRDTLTKNPDAWMPHNNLGNIVLPKDAKEAEHHYREALRIKPGHYPAQSNLAEALRRQGRYEEAMIESRKAIALMQEQVERRHGERLPPFVASDYDALGRSLMMLDRLQEAEDAFRQSIAIAPGEMESHFLLAQMLTDQKRTDEAESVLRHVATTGRPDWRTWRALAVLLTRQEKHAEAVKAYERALEVAPSVETQLIIAPLLIRLLATSPDNAVRDIPRALSIAQQLCDATGWSEPSLIDVLASVHYEAGQIQDAIRLGEMALSLAQQNRQNELAEQIAQRVEQYRAGLKPQP